MQTTPNYNFKKIDLTDSPPDITVLNTNADIADTEIKKMNNRVKTDVPINAKFTDTVYTHPSTHPPSIISQDANNRFVTDTEKNGWNKKADSNPNLLINPDFSRWERGTTFPVIGTEYTTDGWIKWSSSGTVTRQPNTSPAPAKYCLRHMCGTTAQYNITAQFLENPEIYMNKPVTLSFWARGIGGLDKLEATILNTKNMFSIASTWQRYTFTATPTSVGIEMDRGVKFATPLISGTSKGYEIACAKLEFGEIATTFVPPLPADNLANCQRLYYQSGTNIDESEASGVAVSSNTLALSVKFPTTMRVKPNLTILDNKFKSRTPYKETILDNLKFRGKENGISEISGDEPLAQLSLIVGLAYAFNYTADASIY